MIKLLIRTFSVVLLLTSCTVQTDILKTQTSTPEPEIKNTPVEQQIMPAASPVSENTSNDGTVFRIIPGESKASYEIGETFLNQQNRFAVAIGVTSEINGEITAVFSNPPASTIGKVTVDISQLTSDNSRRDEAIRNRWLESYQYPMAVFTPQKIEGLPAEYVEGEDYTFYVTGDLTVHEITKEVAFIVTANLSGDTLTGTATTTVKLSDFGVGPISIAGILNTEDDVKLTLDFVARP